MRKAKTKSKQYDKKNPIEQLLSGLSGGTSQANESVINADNWDQYLGLTVEKGKQRKRSGDLKPGEEINFAKPQEEKLEKQERKEMDPGINYSREIVHVGERAANRENRQLETQLREIMAEIKKLADSSKELQNQFREVAVEQYVAAPGKYHKSFFSWLLSVIRATRAKVEDSGTWLQAMRSKRKSREYGAMAKKQGTSFTLNNERTVATQVG